MRKEERWRESKTRAIWTVSRSPDGFCPNKSGKELSNGREGCLDNRGLLGAPNGWDRSDGGGQKRRWCQEGRSGNARKTCLFMGLGDAHLPRPGFWFFGVNRRTSLHVFEPVLHRARSTQAPPDWIWFDLRMDKVSSAVVVQTATGSSASRSFGLEIETGK